MPSHKNVLNLFGVLFVVVVLAKVIKLANIIRFCVQTMAVYLWECRGERGKTHLYSGHNRRYNISRRSRHFPFLSLDGKK